MKRTITIKASSVSSAIGVGFTSPSDLIQEILYPTKHKNKPFSNNPIVKKANEFKSQNSADVQKKIKELTRELDKTPIKSLDIMDESDSDDDDAIKTRNELKKEVTKILATNHGTLHEATTANDCKRSLCVYEPMGALNICKIGEVDFVVVGYVDRIEYNEDGTKTLIEIKNRINRLFYKVRDYENIQCQVYLQMFNDIQQCRLIEQYNDKINEMTIEKDNHEWNTSTLPKLKQFCEELYKANQKMEEEYKSSHGIM